MATVGSSLSIQPGTRLLGHYSVVRELGRGGMGVVYLVTDPDLDDRQFAVKVVASDHGGDARFAAQFKREAQALLAVRHDAVVAFYQYKRDEALASYCLVMEYVQGTPLSELLAQGPLPNETIAILERRLLRGLKACHAKGVVHRDIAPDNIVLPNADPAQAKLIDFGIATQLRVDEKTVFVEAGRPLKAAYASPEQLRGEAVIGEKSDIYSLGLVLLNCAEDPKAPANLVPASLYDLVRSRESVPLMPPGLNREIAFDLERMLDPDPERRPGAEQLSAQIGSGAGAGREAAGQGGQAPPGPAAHKRERPHGAAPQATPAGSGEVTVKKRFSPMTWGLLGLVAAAAVVLLGRDGGQTGAPPPPVTQTQPVATSQGPSPAGAPAPAPGLAAAVTPPPPPMTNRLPDVVLIPPEAQAEVRPADKSVLLAWKPAGVDFRGEYVIERSEGAAFVAVGTTRATRYADTSVNYGVSYRYQVTARQGRDQVTGLPVAASLPVPQFPVTALSAKPGAGFAREVRLGWQGRGDPRGVKSFIVFRRQDKGREKRVATVSNVAAFVDRDVDYGVDYAYRVAAMQLDDQLGDSSPTAEIRLTAPRFPLTALETGAPLGETTRTAAVKWRGEGDPASVDFFTVERSQEGRAPTRIKLARDRVATGDGFVYLDDTVAFATEYRYRVIPTLVDGREDRATPEAGFFLAAPRLELSAPKVEPAWMAPGEVNLSWSAQGATEILRGYTLLRSENGAELRRLADQTVARHLDRGLAYGKQYRYQVVAHLDGGGEARSPVVEYRMPPAAVQGLEARVDGAVVALRWKVGDAGPGRFAVYRSEVELSPDETQRLAVVEAGEWLDERPMPCKSNYYSVRALDGDGRPGELSAIVGARVHALLGPVEGVQCRVFGGQAFLDWTGVESCDLSAYRIEIQRGGNWQQAGVTDRTWWSVDLPGGQEADLRISVINAAGQAGRATPVKVRDGVCP